MLVGASATNPVRIDPTGTTVQPVSGTITANQGTSPWVVSLASTTITGTVAENLTQVAGVVLGATAVTAYGTAPAAANVPGVNAFITNTPAVTLASTTITGNVTVVQPTGTNLHVVVDSSSALTASVTGTKSNNAVVPGATNLGVLPALANAATPTWTEGNEVLLSVDLSGHQRVVCTGVVPNNTVLAPSNWGNPVLVAGSDGVSVYWLPINLDGNIVSNAYSVTIGGKDLSGFAHTIQTDSAGKVCITGNLLNNNTFPTNSNVGVLPAIANAAAPTWAEGVQVLLSTDLSGSLRVKLAAGAATIGAVTGTLTNNNAAPAATNIGALPALANAASPTWTEGDVVFESVDLSGNQRTLPSGVYNTTSPAPAAAGKTPLQQDYAGSLFTKPIRRSETVSQATTISLSAAATTILAAQAAGIFTDISNLIITPTAAATTSIPFTATLSDGTKSFIFDMETGSLTTAAAPVININFNPPLSATTAATVWTIALSVATVAVHVTVNAVLQKAS